MITVNRKTRVRRPHEAWRDAIPGVHIATEQEGQELFDYQARKTLGISGEEFLARWDAGEFRDLEDDAEGRKIDRLVMLIPFVRRVPAQGGFAGRSTGVGNRDRISQASFEPPECGR